MTARAGTVFRGVLIVAIFAILLWVVASAKTGRPPVTSPRAAAEPAGELLIPVAGVRAAQLTDTFTQARGQGRPHDAIDIMAPRGTAVIAAADGTVEKLFFSNGGGGITAYVRSPDRQWIYYYAHLDGYAPGLAEGRHVRRGDPIGRVGSTGNASATAPHLHFAVHVMGPADDWWQGRPTNPYPLLAGQDRARPH